MLDKASLLLNSYRALHNSHGANLALQRIQESLPFMKHVFLLSFVIAFSAQYHKDNTKASRSHIESIMWNSSRLTSTRPPTHGTEDKQTVRPWQRRPSPGQSLRVVQKVYYAHAVVLSNVWSSGRMSDQD